MSWDTEARPAPARFDLSRRKERAIDRDARVPQGDLILGLLNLLERNRLALVVLAASLTSGARMRARGAYTESTAARWLARNARLVRHFLHSLAMLRRCAGRAGYRALGRAQPVRRLYASPRILLPAVVAGVPLTALVCQGRDGIRPSASPAEW